MPNFSSNLWRFTRWLTLIFFVGVTLLLVVLRWQPIWLVAFYNNVQDSIAIELSKPEITFLPITIAAEDIGVQMEGLELVVTSVDASVSISELWDEQPFWALYAGTVDVQTTPTGESSGGGGFSIPTEALAFTTVNVSQLKVDEQLSGRIKLTQSVPGTIEVDLAIDQSADGETLSLAATGSLTQTNVNTFASNLTLAVSQGDSLAVTSQLLADVTLGDATRILLDNSQATIDGSGERTSLQSITGEIVLGSDTLRIDNLNALLSHAESEPHALALSGQVGLDEEREFSFEGTIRNPSEQSTKAQFSGNLGVATSVGLTLDSSGLPTFVGALPLSGDQLYPLQITGELEIADASLKVTDFQLTSPANTFSSSLSYQPEPLVISVELNAKMLSIPLLASAQASEEAVPNPEVPTQEVTSSKEETLEADSDEAPLFSDQPIDWAWLETGSVEFTAKADVLNLQEAAFQDFQMVISSDPGIVRLSTLQGNLGDGGFSGSSEIAKSEQGAEMQMQFNLERVALEEFGFVPQDELAGGQLLSNIRLATRGASPAELAANLNGLSLLLLDSATLSNDVVEIVGSDVFTETLNKLNPFYKEDPSTQVACALARFEIQDGVLKSDRELILETDKMEIFGDGKVELAKDSIDITFSPSAKQGIGVNVGSLVKFLKLGGSVRKPAPEVDALGVLHSGAAIGAAVATGGVSVLAEGLAKRVINAGSVCDKYRLPQPMSES